MYSLTLQLCFMYFHQLQSFHNILFTTFITIFFFGSIMQIESPINLILATIVFIQSLDNSYSDNLPNFINFLSSFY